MTSSPSEDEREAPEEPRIHRTVIRSARFTFEEWAAVQERAVAVALSPSRYLRHVALGAPLGRRINAEAVTALNRAGVNLNNLVRLAIRNGQPLVAADVEGVLEELRAALRGFL
jgi:hypothetical protein